MAVGARDSLAAGVQGAKGAIGDIISSPQRLLDHLLQPPPPVRESGHPDQIPAFPFDVIPHRQQVEAAAPNSVFTSEHR